MVAKLVAPWTEEQVEALRAWQARDDVHPYTAAERWNGLEVVLIPTREGWRETIDGPVVQDWAHDFSAGLSKADLP